MPKTRRNIAWLFAALLVLGVAGRAHAQLRGDLGFHGALAIPYGPLAHDLGEAGIGFGFRGGLGWYPIPLRAGLQVDAAWLVFGHERISAPLRDAPNTTRHVDLLSHVVMAHVWLRAQPWEGVVRPFAQALLGFKRFATDIDVTLTSRTSDARNTSTRTDAHALALSYGLGVGLDVRVGGSRDGRHEGFITLGASMLWGARGEHPSPRSDREPSAALPLSTARSPTHVVFPYVGLSMTLGAGSQRASASAR